MAKKYVSPRLRDRRRDKTIKYEYMATAYEVDKKDSPGRVLGEHRFFATGITSAKRGATQWYRSNIEPNPYPFSLPNNWQHIYSDEPGKSRVTVAYVCGMPGNRV